MLPTQAKPVLHSEELPLLLKNYTQLCVKSASYTPTPAGYSPLNRPIAEHLKYGVINLDKVAGPSSHEVVSWVKRILNVEKTGHSGTLDPMVSGNLLVCIDRATRLVKSQQAMGKSYVSILQFNNYEAMKKQFSKDQMVLKIKEVSKLLTAPQLQRPPAEGCAVKRVLRVREIYKMDILEFNYEEGRIVFKVDCESGTYIRVLCQHFGYLMGCDAFMLELRRVRSGCLDETTNMVTLHDVLDAAWLLKNQNDESYIRKVVMPLEALLIDEKKVFIKDSAVNSITYGAPLLIQGVVRYSSNISIGDTVIICSTKGEAIALAKATMSSVDIAGLNHGVVCKTTRVIMDRDTYEKQWGKGEQALERLQLIEKGLLGKHGEIQDNTPHTWRTKWTDVQKFLEEAGNTCANAGEYKVVEEKTHIHNEKTDITEEERKAQKEEKKRAKEAKKKEKEEKKEKNEKDEEKKEKKEKKESKKD
ncbi:Centromere/microtubule binding protein CBF5 [Spironucleus salmonicida]|uniref:Centromere/microtubule binding protein CBF5 n=1 Tax=Spironucleus salmonicida TaxID=348837 RepID=V6LPE4_9EUKA|nr:Centromere/microtubule binding protein CBF5 [Spironucleus salmonicida]|eukprot:EST45586.1 Centromere/microtubule binding protein CBF5 [Spironucleus salmonicida]